MKEVDVIFFVEHKDRELESIKLIANKLKEKGKKSLILSVYFHVHYLYLYKAKVFVFPYLINKNDWPVSLVYKMYGDKVEYMNMNWEQLLSPVNMQYKKPQDSFVKDIVKHIAWDENFKNHLVAHSVKKGNIIVTGNPANEILYNLLDKKSEWREKLSQEFGLDKNKKWLFLPMNYGWAFSSDKLIQSKINKGYPKNIAWQYREYSQKCLKKFIHFIKEISKKYDYEIIIRPHPSITEDDYREVFIKEIEYIPKKILLSKSYSIREWIIASDIIGSSWSTSVWDAYNIGKPVFLFTPYKRPEWLNVWWNDKVFNVKEINEYKEELLSKKENVNFYSNYKPSYLISDFLVKMINKNNSFSFYVNLNVVIHIIKSFGCRFLNIKKCLYRKYDYFEVIKVV